MVSWEEAERLAELALSQPPKIDEHEARQARKAQLKRERDVIVEEIHQDVKSLFKAMDEGWSSIHLQGSVEEDNDMRGSSRRL